MTRYVPVKKYYFVEPQMYSALAMRFMFGQQTSSDWRKSNYQSINKQISSNSIKNLILPRTV